MLRGFGRYNEGQIYCTPQMCSGKGDIKASFERLQALLQVFSKGVAVDGKLTPANAAMISKIAVENPTEFAAWPVGAGYSLVTIAELAVELTGALQAVIDRQSGNVLAPSRNAARPPTPVVKPPDPVIVAPAPPTVPGYPAPTVVTPSPTVVAPSPTVTPDTPTSAIPIGPTVTITPSEPAPRPPVLAPVTTTPNVGEKIKSSALAQRKRIIVGGIAIAAIGILGAGGATIYRKRKRSSASV